MSIFLITPFVFFAILNILTIYIGKHKFGYCIPITVMLSALILYYS